MNLVGISPVIFKLVMFVPYFNFDPGTPLHSGKHAVYMI